MIHVGCGGEVKEDWNDPYEFDGEDARMFGKIVPKYVCSKCGEEILGDCRVWIPGWSEFNGGYDTDNS